MAYISIYNLLAIALYLEGQSEFEIQVVVIRMQNRQESLSAACLYCCCRYRTLYQLEQEIHENYAPFSVWY